MTIKKNPSQNLYQESYCKKLEEHMTKGHSFESFAGLIGVGTSTLYEWKNHYKEFKESFKIGHAKSLLFYEKKGIKGMDKGKQFNDKVWSYSMVNRFGWSDKNSISFSEPEKMSKDEIEKEIIKIEQALEKNEI
jgi:hypothetical protein